MRRILFRGKQIDNEDWVLGYLWVGNENSYFLKGILFRHGAKEVMR